MIPAERAERRVSSRPCGMEMRIEERHVAGGRAFWLRSEGLRRLALIAAALWMLLWGGLFISTTLRISSLHHQLEKEIALASHPAVPEDAGIAQQALALLQSEIDSDRPWQFTEIFMGLCLPMAGIAGVFAMGWVIQGFKKDQAPATPSTAERQPSEPRSPGSRYRPDLYERSSIPNRPVRR